MKAIGAGVLLLCVSGQVWAIPGIGHGRKLVDADAGGKLTVYAVAPDVFRIDYVPTGVKAIPSPILDPKGLRNAKPVGTAKDVMLKTDLGSAELIQGAVRVQSKDGTVSLRIDRAGLAKGLVQVSHAFGENLYGMRGYGLWPKDDGPRTSQSQGLLRNAGAPVSAGSQGDGGAPLAFSTKWGLFIDSVDGDFTNDGAVLQFRKGSRKDLEAYVVIGGPKRVISAVTDLTGRSPMPPKWSLGFMNSQWGTDQKVVESLVDQYRKKQIPLDAFILDFDFKAWGEDNYGEWRWNSTNAPGNYSPDKFPDGQSGKFAQDLLAKGVRVVGIMKPRILVENTEKKPTMAAVEAHAHNWFLPNQKPYTDYFSHRLANDIDFSKPDARAWYWSHSKGLFDTGIAGWWNDEADDTFPSLGFFQMQQSLYEGQRSVSKERVWSLNRNWYVGAQRFAFGTWSGDINTGFDVLATQPKRMLVLLNLAQPHWSMDTGGFNGHPSDENYARWVECAAVVPIMRVHGTFNEHRQPWVYGPVAEAAAKKAIEFRYRLFPTLYSLEREAHETGVGIARPLFWEFPTDPGSANVTDSWMVGDSLLAAPVLNRGEKLRKLYLPPGTWIDYASGQRYEGGRSIERAVDSENWSDLPLFVRAGSIVATRPVEQFEDQDPSAEITLDVWPDDARPAKFRVYDDDGHTYAYEKGEFFSQDVTVTSDRGKLNLVLDRPVGRFRPAYKKYRVAIHGTNARTFKLRGRAIQIQAQPDIVTFEVPAGERATVSGE
jgi:alpha-glucosidase (family GH31 glycosyl hydrolase)